jgi:hypothetical protein
MMLADTSQWIGIGSRALLLLQLPCAVASVCMSSRLVRARQVRVRIWSFPWHKTIAVLAVFCDSVPFAAATLDSLHFLQAKA